MGLLMTSPCPIFFVSFRTTSATAWWRPSPIWCTATTPRSATRLAQRGSPGKPGVTREGKEGHRVWKTRSSTCRATKTGEQDHKWQKISRINFIHHGFSIMIIPSIASGKHNYGSFIRKTWHDRSDGDELKYIDVWKGNHHRWGGDFQKLDFIPEGRLWWNTGGWLDTDTQDMYRITLWWTNIAMENHHF